MSSHGHHDSAGHSWLGRELSLTGFEADRGDCDPDLLDAMSSATANPSADAERHLMSHVARCRWLVPVVATPGDTGVTRGGLDVDVTADVATVTIASPDGRRALPVFSGVATLARWDATARPVPVRADRAAQAAVTESCDVLLLDLGSAHAVALRPSMVWALAMGRPWTPAFRDDHVVAAVDAAVRDERDVVGHRCEEGDPVGEGVLRVVLVVRPGLQSADVAALASRVGERMATDGEVRARVDALTFSLVSG